jgi:hypothetical protein
VGHWDRKRNLELGDVHLGRNSQGPGRGGIPGVSECDLRRAERGGWDGRTSDKVKRLLVNWKSDVKEGE